MSAPLAGKFQDHYAILGVDPGADNETIQIAYAKMIEKYGPEGDADPEKLEIASTAYETLSDPELRKEFDKIKGVSRDNGRPMFAGVEFFDILGQQVGLRGALLSVLYDRRRTNTSNPALSMRQLERMLDADVEALNFALWYLKQRGFVAPDDKSSLQITATGMDYLETKRPEPEEIMPFIKVSAIVGSASRKPVAQPIPQAAKEPEDEAEAESEPELQPQPVMAAPSRPPLGKLDGNTIRNMASRGISRR